MFIKQKRFTCGELRTFLRFFAFQNYFCVVCRTLRLHPMLVSLNTTVNLAMSGIEHCGHALLHSRECVNIAERHQ